MEGKRTVTVIRTVEITSVYYDDMVPSDKEFEAGLKELVDDAHVLKSKTFVMDEE